MDKKRTLILWGLTLAINGLVVLTFYLPRPGFLEGMDFSWIPPLNAALNTMTFLCLVGALVSIKRKNIKAHRNFIIGAFSFTAVFLLSYLTYHFSTPSTPHGGEGLVKSIYLFFLLTHIPLAAIVVPLALFTASRGLSMDVKRHKKISKWTMPIWLYVSATGVIVYFMIAPYYS